MLTKLVGEYDCKCDVCGSSERVTATSHRDAWEIIKHRAWAIRHNAFPIIHICPECPVEAVKKIAPSR